MLRQVRFVSRAAFALPLLALAGCGQHKSVLAPQAGAGAPVLELRAARDLSSTAAKPRYALTWQTKGGAADHFVYAINPLSADRVDANWQSTNATSFSLAVPAKRSAAELALRRPAQATTFVVRAVDARGRMSHPEQISILDDNIAPSVQIVRPPARGAFQTLVAPNIDVEWQGNDPDGVPTSEPAYYKWTVLTDQTPVTIATALSDPDSVRRYYEPRDYAGWNSVGGVGFESPATKVLGMIPSLLYMFVVVAQDRLGAYTHVFSFDTNMLYMRAAPAGVGAPRITLFGSFFSYTYALPNANPDSVFQVPLEIATGQPVTINWSGQPAFGSEVTGYRWAIDIADVHDETPRTGPGDTAHWSGWSLTPTSALMGPFAGSEEHRLYVEARDSYQRVSLGIVHVAVVQATFDRTLLVVNDTRFLPDMRSGSNGCMNPPVGRWPTAAELDTFLFARGGFPWRCYPAGTLTGPGLFAGYPFDTLGTRGLPGGVVTLDMLRRYAHVVWLTDNSGALNTNLPGSGTSPITALRYMTQSGQSNSLVSYLLNGGHLWAAGGGVTLASLIEFNNRANDPPSGFGAGITFTWYFPNELVPGRLPYDAAGWQSEIKISTPQTISFVRTLGRYEESVGPYGGLPHTLEPKSAATDPLPPQRTNPGDFYATLFTAEYLSQPNDIQEDLDPGPGESFVSTLDSLYSARGGQLVQNDQNVTMTVYRPTSGQPRIWTGFSLWNFRRADCQALVDWVLQREWGLIRTAPSPLARSNAGGAWRPQPTTRH